VHPAGSYYTDCK